jgi:hypothetical protein
MLGKANPQTEMGQVNRFVCEYERKYLISFIQSSHQGIAVKTRKTKENSKPLSIKLKGFCFFHSDLAVTLTKTQFCL